MTAPDDVVARNAKYRTVLSRYPTGVVVVTAIDSEGEPIGMTVGSFTSVSLNPPLVAFFPDKASTSFPKIRGARSFCVNVLASDQESVCRSFAVKKGKDKFAGLNWMSAPSGAPLLDGVVAWIDCEVDTIREAGDHYIVVGRVLDLDVHAAKSALLFVQGGYGSFRTSVLSAPGERDLLGLLRFVDGARTELERLASDASVECIAVGRVGDELVMLGSANWSKSMHNPTRVGQRSPLVAPLGGSFLSHAPGDEVTKWIDRFGPVPAHVTNVYHNLLVRIRERGWSLVLRSPEQAALENAIVSAEVMTPTAGDQHAVYDAANILRQRVTAVSTDEQLYEPVLTMGRSYSVSKLSAPVLSGPSGDVQISIMLSGFSRPLTTEQIHAFADRLVDTCGRIARDISRSL